MGKLALLFFIASILAGAMLPPVAGVFVIGFMAGMAVGPALACWTVRERSEMECADRAAAKLAGALARQNAARTRDGNFWAGLLPPAQPEADTIGLEPLAPAEGARILSLLLWERDRLRSRETVKRV